MNRVIIIGAGELGSRHLQGIVRSSRPLEITCIDLFESALIRARKRLEEIEQRHLHKVFFSSQYDNLPNEADIAIIATNFRERLEVMKILLDKVKVKYLILEKVLFPKLQDYNKVWDLVGDNVMKIWVNCPRRMDPAYQQIRKDLRNNRHPITMTVTGNSWNMGSNAIHFIDLFAFFTGDTSIDISTKSLDRKIFPSKRNGYFEFSGTMIISDQSGNTCVLHSNDGEPGSIEVSIESKVQKITVKENEYVEVTSGDKIIKREPHIMKFQSQLSNIVADDLFENGNTSLTPLSESIQIHMPLINSLMIYFNEVTGQTHSTCPIS